MLTPFATVINRPTRSFHPSPSTEFSASHTPRTIRASHRSISARNPTIPTNNLTLEHHL